MSPFQAQAGTNPATHCTIVSPLARVRVNNNGRKQEEAAVEGVAQHIVFQQLRSMRNYFA